MNQVRTNPFAVVILGMHRSGTSCLAGSLQRCGLHLGSVSEHKGDNQRGNRENSQIQLLNDSVLEASGGSWRAPPPRVVWDASHEAERDEIIGALAAPGRPWGFKDPRTLITWPFWKGGLTEFKMVGTFRHPLPVERSLQARSVTKTLEFRPKLTVENGLALWKEYNVLLLTLAREHGVPLVSFDATCDEYLASIRRVAGDLGIVPRGEPGLDPFYEESLRHQVGGAPPAPLPSEISDIYAELCRIYDGQTRV